MALSLGICAVNKSATGAASERLGQLFDDSDQEVASGQQAACASEPSESKPHFKSRSRSRGSEKSRDSKESKDCKDFALNRANSAGDQNPAVESTVTEILKTMQQQLMMQSVGINKDIETATTATMAVASAMQFLQQQSMGLEQRAAAPVEVIISLTIPCVPSVKHQNPVQILVAPPLVCQVPDSIQRHLQVATAKFENCEKYLKADRSTKPDDDALRVFDDNSSGIRYPAGCRPFKSASEFGELDEAFTDAADGDFNILTVIPQGTSRRRAMELMHHNAVMC